MVELPPALDARWHTHGYYGSVSHNVRAIYQRYLGWYDGNPAHLWQHPPSGRRPATPGWPAARTLGRQGPRVRRRWRPALRRRTGQPRRVRRARHGGARDVWRPRYPARLRRGGATWRNCFLIGADGTARGHRAHPDQRQRRHGPRHDHHPAVRHDRHPHRRATRRGHHCLRPLAVRRQRRAVPHAAVQRSARPSPDQPHSARRSHRPAHPRPAHRPALLGFAGRHRDRRRRRRWPKPPPGPGCAGTRAPSRRPPSNPSGPSVTARWQAPPYPPGGRANPPPGRRSCGLPP